MFRNLRAAPAFLEAQLINREERAAAIFSCLYHFSGIEPGDTLKPISDKGHSQHLPWISGFHLTFR
ncbi:hypothetical protein E2C01_101405 [Portunus trituberculatus]|uniref:Uncharacterized protein n=1 Tax=Portunus trituberculatus TaxID=210409 RepID=A0A5B7KEP2_PORTR|nr:hypothetical protein [Portunus trituberculatus]